MCNFLRKSLSVEIVNFISAFNNYSTKKLSSFTKSAFIQSRNKINPEVFKHLSSTLIHEFYTDNEASVKLWEGYRLLAVDGSTVTLPNTLELESIYGFVKNQHKYTVVQARTSILYDVLNKLAIDSLLSPLKTGELKLAMQHLVHTQENDLIIYDRGYPSFDLVYEHNELKRDFVIRVKKDFSNVIKDFVSSGELSQVVEIQPNQKRSMKSKNYSLDSKIEVRLVSVNLGNGTREILMTSLLNDQKYPTEIFKELYFKRWGVETFYDELKNKLKVEHFSGYSNNTIQQDFNVAVFISNIQSLIVNELEEEIQEKTKNRKLKYKVNTNLSYGFLKNRILALLKENKDMEKELKALFKEHLIPERPSRNNKRDTDRYRRKTKPKVTKNHKDAI